MRVSLTSGVFLASTLEYLTREVLDMAGEWTQDQGMTDLITPRAVRLVMQGDVEIDRLLSNVIVPRF